MQLEAKKRQSWRVFLRHCVDSLHTTDESHQTKTTSGSALIFFYIESNQNMADIFLLYSPSLVGTKSQYSIRKQIVATLAGDGQPLQ